MLSLCRGVLPSEDASDEPAFGIAVGQDDRGQEVGLQHLTSAQGASYTRRRSAGRPRQKIEAGGTAGPLRSLHADRHDVRHRVTVDLDLQPVGSGAQSTSLEGEAIHA